MTEILLAPDEVKVDEKEFAQEIYEYQLGIAQRYAFFVPEGRDASPVHEYQYNLRRMGVVFLAPDLMLKLISHWQRTLTILNTGGEIPLAYSRYLSQGI